MITKDELDYLFISMKDQPSNYKTSKALAYMMLELEGSEILPMLVLKYTEIQEMYNKYSLKCEELKIRVSAENKLNVFLQSLTEEERKCFENRYPSF